MIIFALHSRTYHQFFFTLLIRVESIDGSAEVGKDYVAVNEILTFEPNELDKQVNSVSVNVYFLVIK